MFEPMAFDLDAIGTAAALPYVLDHRGRAHLGDPDVGELTFTPEGTTARCDVALISTVDGNLRPTTTRRLIHNRYRLPLDRAAALAMIFTWLGGWRRRNPEPDVIDAQLQVLVATTWLAHPGLPPELLTGSALMRLESSRGEAAVHAVLTDPVHPVWLSLAFLAGRYEPDAEEYQHDDVSGESCTRAAIMFGDRAVAVCRIPGEDLVHLRILTPDDESIEDSAHFRMPAESALLLLTVHEGLQYSNTASWASTTSAALSRGRSAMGSSGCVTSCSTRTSSSNGSRGSVG